MFRSLGCVHINTSTSTSSGPDFGLQLVEALLVQVERLWSLVPAHN